MISKPPPRKEERGVRGKTERENIDFKTTTKKGGEGSEGEDGNYKKHQ